MALSVAAATAIPAFSTGGSEELLILGVPPELPSSFCQPSNPDPTTAAAASFWMNTGTSIDQEVPSSLFFSYPLCHGHAPSGRWSHTCVGLNNNLLVMYGGVGRAVLDELCALDVQTMCWRQIPVSAKNPKDRPDKMLGHAAASVGNRMWMFGGQEGRSFLRKLYSIDSDTWTWQRHSSDSLPAARAGHALSTVNGSMYMFGGQGKKMYNDLYTLNPETAEFTEVKPCGAGKAPTPRKGMSFVYDGRDSLVCFGGTHAGGIDNQLTVFSISRQEWFSPPQLGPIPSARTNHSVVTLSPRQMLFFGGCNAQGVFFQDTYVLDTRTFTWHRPQQLNPSPAPRYHHSCTMVGDKVFLFGGISAKQTFDGIVVLDSKFNTDISHIAEELQSLISDGWGNNASASAGGSRHGGTPVRREGSTLDSMKLQLTDLLVKRNMEEMHALAARKAEDMIGLLQREREAKEAVSKELLQAKLMAAEADETVLSWKLRLKESAARAIKDSASISELRAASEKANSGLEAIKLELQQSKRLKDGLVKELGVMSSRYAQLQEYCDGLSRKVLKQGNSRSDAKAAAATESLSPLPRGTSKFSFDLQSTPKLAATTSMRALSVPEMEMGAVSPVGIYKDSSYLLLERLSESENQRAVLMAETQRLRQQVEASLERSACDAARLEQLQAKPAALSSMSRSMLSDLESQMEGSLRTVRELIMTRKVLEAQQQVSAEANNCSVCLEHPKSVVFGCGHQSCGGCSSKLTFCPFCRKEIVARIKLFDA